MLPGRKYNLAHNKKDRSMSAAFHTEEERLSLPARRALKWRVRLAEVIYRRRRR